jgi:CHAT domain-containing protein
MTATLSASEVAALKLDADWVILFACNTPLAARTAPEALSGLGRAFIYAGARALPGLPLAGLLPGHGEAHYHRV